MGTNDVQNAVVVQPSVLLTSGVAQSTSCSLIIKLHLDIKMASTNLSVDEAINMVFDEGAGCLSDIMDEEFEQDEEEENPDDLRSFLNSFSGGNNFNKDLFVVTAQNLLTPLVKACSSRESQVAKTLLSSNINAKLCLESEPKLWIANIYRRLAGARGVRQPFQGQIHRNIPVDIFQSLARAIKSTHEEDFREPFCYVRGNSKGLVISLTKKCLLIKLLCLLSGKTNEYVTCSLQRTLGGHRKGVERKILVSYDKDFALVYNFKKGQLSLQFHYGEWNPFGFPMHTCKLDLSAT